ncbi:MAG: hypothetical protein ACE5G0_22870, partial [Rhodothermales bacterium]
MRGSTVVPPRDLGELARLSQAVLLARASTSTTIARGGMIVTLTTFEVVEVVQGTVRQRDHVVVETYGGVSDGVGWMVAGSPRFSEDTVYLLFLNRRGRVWQPRMLAYGLLERTLARDGSVVLSHIAEHHELELLPRPDGTLSEPVGTYYEEPLLRHLREVVTARTVWDQRQALVPLALHPTTHAASKTSDTIPSPCVYMSYDGYTIRWNTFDNGQPVTVYAEESGGSAEVTAVQNGLSAWNSFGDIDLHWGGTSPYTPDCSDGRASPGDLAADQGLVQYDDPCSEIPDLASCSGTLAIGGSFFMVGPTGRHAHRGLEWNTSTIGYVIVNNDVATCLSSNQYRLMMTHELGHTLGFDHIPVASGASIMNPSCCNDITVIDQNCALFSYSDA